MTYTVVLYILLLMESAGVQQSILNLKALFICSHADLFKYDICFIRLSYFVFIKSESIMLGLYTGNIKPIIFCSDLQKDSTDKVHIQWGEITIMILIFGQAGLGKQCRPRSD